MAEANAFVNNYRSDPGWKSLVILSCLLIGIRFLFTGVMGIMPQDAYYDFYAQHLDLSYYDHPPLIAYLLRFFTTLFGKKVFVLKLADTTVTLLTVIAFYQLAKKFLSGQKALVATCPADFHIHDQYTFPDLYAGCTTNVLLDLKFKLPV